MKLVETILVNKSPQFSTEDILTMLDIKTADIKETRFYQEILEAGLLESRLADELEGKIEGRKEEAIAICGAIRILRRRSAGFSRGGRFGDLINPNMIFCKNI